VSSKLVALALLLALAGCGGAEVKDDPPAVKAASASDPPPGSSHDPPLGFPRAKVSPSIVSKGGG
jgi:hypothetical protein